MAQQQREIREGFDANEPVGEFLKRHMQRAQADNAYGVAMRLELMTDDDGAWDVSVVVRWERKTNG